MMARTVCPLTKTLQYGIFVMLNFVDEFDTRGKFTFCFVLYGNVSVSYHCVMNV